MAEQHGLPSSDREAGNLDAVMAGALVLLDQVEALQPFIPELTPGDRERVDSFVGRALADATLRAYKSDWALNRAGFAGGRWM